MSAHRDAHRIARAFGRVTIDTISDKEAHDRALGMSAAGDMAQQLHIRARGKAGRVMNFSEAKVYWPNPFLNRVAQGQISSTLVTPTFLSGVEMLTDSHVLIDVQVRDWLADESDWLIGARVRFGAWAPAAPKLTPYSAIVHMTFLGYAAPAEDDSEE